MASTLFTKTLDEFHYECSVTLNMRIMDHLMSWSISVFLGSFFKLYIKLSKLAPSSEHSRNVSCWCILTISRNDSILTGTGPISAFCSHKVLKLGFPGFLKRTHGRTGLKFGVQVYHDHIQNWFDFGFRIDEIWVKVWWFSYFLVHFFYLAKCIKFESSMDFLKKSWSGWSEKGGQSYIVDSWHWVPSSLTPVLGRSTGTVPTMMPCFRFLMSVIWGIFWSRHLWGLSSWDGYFLSTLRWMLFGNQSRTHYSSVWTTKNLTWSLYYTSIPFMSSNISSVSIQFHICLAFMGTL